MKSQFQRQHGDRATKFPALSLQNSRNLKCWTLHWTVIHVQSPTIVMLTIFFPPLLLLSHYFWSHLASLNSCSNPIRQGNALLFGEYRQHQNQRRCNDKWPLQIIIMLCNLHLGPFQFYKLNHKFWFKMTQKNTWLFVTIIFFLTTWNKSSEKNE